MIYSIQVVTLWLLISTICWYNLYIKCNLYLEHIYLARGVVDEPASTGWLVRVDPRARKEVDDVFWSVFVSVGYIDL